MREHAYSGLMSEVMLQALRTLNPRPTNFLLDQVPAKSTDTQPD